MQRLSEREQGASESFSIGEGNQGRARLWEGYYACWSPGYECSEAMYA